MAKGLREATQRAGFISISVRYVIRRDTRRTNKKGEVMSREFDDLVRRATCQMKVMLRERRRFRVLAKELETFTKKGITDRQ